MQEKIKHHYRKIAPPSVLVEFNSALDSRMLSLSNGILVNLVSCGTQEVMRIELGFKAGSWYQPAKSVATATNMLIPNGTSKHTADQIAEYFEFYGSHVETNTEKDHAYITLYTLNKYYKNTLPMLAEVLMDAIFPDEEVVIYRKTKKQALSVNLQKVKYLARINFNEQIFGKGHPYGMRLHFEDIDRLEAELLREFHRKFYRSENCFIFVSGLLPPGFEKEMEFYFGQLPGNREPSPSPPAYSIESSLEQKQFVSLPNNTQSALRIGKATINRTHPDYQGLSVLNTMLGGYFGSRLMKNLREDKGFTYGISSALLSLQQSGMLVIASEVGASKRERAVKEIYKEIRKLKQEPVPDEELDLVRNYMLGALMRGLDGPFAVAERLRGAYEYGQGKDYFYAYAQTIRLITSSRLLELANQYLDEKSLFETVAGV